MVLTYKTDTTDSGISIPGVTILASAPIDMNICRKQKSVDCCATMKMRITCELLSLFNFWKREQVENSPEYCQELNYPRSPSPFQNEKVAAHWKSSQRKIEEL